VAYIPYQFKGEALVFLCDNFKRKRKLGGKGERREKRGREGQGVRYV